MAGDLVLLRGGVVVAGPDRSPVVADVLVRDGLVAEVGTVSTDDCDTVIDCRGRVVVPGFVDVHSHADAAVLDPSVQLANLRQGVTTVVVGLDGVSFAPGDGRYATEYFGALDGRHATYRGGDVADLLTTYDGTTALNVGYLIPAGTVRHEVMGYASRTPEAVELDAMVGLVARGMRQGALGLSTGLDYVPGLYADTDELTALCRPVADAGGVHASHMRGGYGDASDEGVAELVAIAQGSGVRTCVSHFTGRSELVGSLVDDAVERGVDLYFDAYPYRRGCTLLGMPILPAALLDEGPGRVLDVLADPERRRALVASQAPLIARRPDMGPAWANHATIAHVSSPEHAWVPGLTVAQAAARADSDPLDFAYRLLVAGGLEVTAVIANPAQSSAEDNARVLTHRRHLAGSDAVYVGEHPHPRGWGTFARLLSLYCPAREPTDVPGALAHLTTASCEVYRLGRRGRVEPGWVADLAVVDLAGLSDPADYDHPRRLATGIDDVLVAGVPVLAAGELTGRTPGTGIRRQRPRDGA